MKEGIIKLCDEFIENYPTIEKVNVVVTANGQECKKVSIPIKSIRERRLDIIGRAIHLCLTTTGLSPNDNATQCSVRFEPLLC